MNTCEVNNNVNTTKNVRQFKNGNFMVYIGDDAKKKWVYMTHDMFCAEYRICAHCGNAVLLDDAIETSDHTFFCSDECAKDAGYVQCYNCDNWIPKDHALEVDEEFFCDDDCVRDCGYAQCEKCGEWVCSDDMIETEDGSLFCSEECAEDAGYRQCHNCDEWHRRRDMYLTADSDEWFCEDCLDDLYWCEGCEQYFEYDDNVTWSDDDECYYCTDCWDSHCGGNRIRSYHASKNADDYTFLRVEDEKRSDVPFMGHELEVDGGHSPGELVEEIADDNPDTFFYEHDGSLSPNGVEIISQPASLLWYEANRDLYKRLRQTCLKYRYSSHDNERCGLHVHVDKQYFGKKRRDVELCVARLLFLFERHWSNLTTFARRTDEQLHWCKRYPGCSSGVERSAIYRAKHMGGYGDRYCALNLTNEHTVEFRLWRGTLNVQTFMATIKFTARLCKLAKETPIAQLARMTWEELLGDDPDIKAYWATRANHDVERTGHGD